MNITETEGETEFYHGRVSSRGRVDRGPGCELQPLAQESCDRGGIVVGRHNGRLEKKEKEKR
jgi:hypothetical protein